MTQTTKDGGAARLIAEAEQMEGRIPFVSNLLDKAILRAKATKKRETARAMKVKP